MKKKKVISIVVDTELTNEDIESGLVHLEVKAADGPRRMTARNVRVLDSDEIVEKRGEN